MSKLFTIIDRIMVNIFLRLFILIIFIIIALLNQFNLVSYEAFKIQYFINLVFVCYNLFSKILDFDKVYRLFTGKILYSLAIVAELLIISYILLLINNYIFISIISLCNLVSIYYDLSNFYNSQLKYQTFKWNHVKLLTNEELNILLKKIENNDIAYDELKKVRKIVMTNYRYRIARLRYPLIIEKEKK